MKNPNENVKVTNKLLVNTRQQIDFYKRKIGN